MTDRRAGAQRWLTEACGWAEPVLETASADASFRRYFRVRHDGRSYIVMDAPPEREDVGLFVRVGERLADWGMHVPEVLAADLDQGYLLLTDFGTVSYEDVLNEDTADRLYGDALEVLFPLHTAGPRAAEGLPPFDARRLTDEMTLFRDWFLVRHLGLAPQDPALTVLPGAFERLVAAALAQPQVLVHRDYHARNLMVMAERNPGVLDYQDAVLGPVTYDLVSLLRDCYVVWPPERVRGWVDAYRDRLQAAGVLDRAQAAEFERWFDWMGLQRHLKVAGIFSRLAWRDGKHRYLGYLPATLDYLEAVSARYPEFAALNALVRDAQQRSMARAAEAGA